MTLSTMGHWGGKRRAKVRQKKRIGQTSGNCREKEQKMQSWLYKNKTNLCDDSQIWISNWSIMQNWPCTKRLIHTISAAFLIFNQPQAEGSIIQQSSHWDSQGPNPERHSILIAILLCWGWSSRDHRKLSKSYILSEALNASLVVSRRSPLPLFVCVWSLLWNRTWGYHSHTHIYTHRYTAVSHNTQALEETWRLQPYPLVYMTTTSCTTHTQHTQHTYTVNLTALHG